MSPQPKKPPAKPNPADEPLESRDDRDEDQDDDRDDDQPQPEQRSWHGESTDELKIIVKADVIEIDVPRDGNEAQVLEQIANLVAEL